MPLTRPARRLIAWLVAACVVFAHTAALASGCAIELSPAAAEAPVAEPCAEHARHGDAAPASANVCEVHCQAVSLPFVSLHVPIALVSTLVIPLELVVPHPALPQPAPPRGKPPPVLLATSRLLI